MSVLVRAVVFLRWIVLDVYLVGFILLETIYLRYRVRRDCTCKRWIACSPMLFWRGGVGRRREVRTLVVALLLYGASIGQVKYTVSQENADCWLDRRSAKLIDFMDDIPGRRRVE